MASKPPDKAARDQNLDQLQQAVNDWSQKEQNRLENEVKFLRAVLQGRSGSDTASSANLASASKLLQNEVDAFVAFGPDSQRT